MIKGSSEILVADGNGARLSSNYRVHISFPLHPQTNKHESTATEKVPPHTNSSSSFHPIIIALVSDDIEPCHYQREEEKCRHAWWTDDLRAFNHHRSVAFRGLVRGHSLRPSYLSVLEPMMPNCVDFGPTNDFVTPCGARYFRWLQLDNKVPLPAKWEWQAKAKT